MSAAAEALATAPFNPFSPDAWLAEAYKAVGQDKSQWRWVNGESHLSTWREVGLGMVVYLGTIFGIQYLMRSRKPFKLTRLAQIHNLTLTLISLGLLVLFVEKLSPILSTRGLFYSVCDVRAWTQPLEVLYYLNYLTKWMEFTDTVFLALKKKPLQFLHVYHHTLTMVLCFTQLNGATSVSWVVITLNLFVHVIMYFYYFLASCGIHPWWKKYVTTLQIVQFVIDLGFVYYCTYQLIASRYYPTLPHRGTCAGTEEAAVFGCALLSSYLLLFIQFFQRTYSKKQAAKKTKTQ
ncbi:Fatty acyl-CoA elongase/Polyunsaturated fatty acid specific elongation enzyme [Coemansia thaxteri]|uniref:Elongation of fatty acids protein n=1 Tax=Coemansia thaxteri TaxID=2663907 RepID=A0A9W8EH30_9FUNG|nr:Fatty acyl-CoA elongase/Polyunsaturated fatty acid specific elongation enzyme [Coemansia thaxteri]KAJ2001918.1 Fatty acyl-CoA elongase/Polyunsaturated fatty acid specific elongation enzyme [Coemansia thaxteri]KAJ2469329.1 Fatty acyl-CoA elongase/Polyunsaturated fatty acid specific elongation enzyme [Coemansia sp. RSA 2322]KAJ2478445.1 Fatty acyl-CoA elongase/Polyunsaturated fatty acid specific elongation enzyme [Coemansia sp. RSA 2320]